MAGHQIRGSRVGAGRAGETARGDSVDRHRLEFFCSNGHITRLSFAIDADLPQTWDCPNCGQPAGLDQQSPPESRHNEPYKTHLAYVKERRSDQDAEALLAEALARVAGKRTPTR
jgi:hypothetical protein